MIYGQCIALPTVHQQEYDVIIAAAINRPPTAFFFREDSELCGHPRPTTGSVTRCITLCSPLIYAVRRSLLLSEASFCLKSEIANF